MERKIYEAPDTEVFVMELNRIVNTSPDAVKDVSSNFTNEADKIKWGGAGNVEVRSKERGGDDFDWDLGF